MHRKIKKIQEEIEKIMDDIEQLAKEDPQHTDWYLAAKEKLEEADSLIFFCLMD